MRFARSFTVLEIANFLKCDFKGNPDQLVLGMNELNRVEPGDLVFSDHPKYIKKALQSEAGVLLINQNLDPIDGKAIIFSNAPFDDFNKLSKRLVPLTLPKKMTGDDCIIADSAHLSPNAFIGKNVEIGENSIIYPGAYIGDNTIIENDVVIGPNAVIGFNAFYYKKKAESLERLYTTGYVHIESFVEIGANSTIDAGVSSITRIGKHTKIDNLVQIGHDTVIGQKCIIAAQVGIAGCVNIGDNTTIWGQVGCASGLTIESGVTVLAQSGVSKNLKANTSYFGSPCEEVKTKFKELAAIKILIKNASHKE